MVLPERYLWFFQKGIHDSSRKVFIVLPEKVFIALPERHLWFFQKVIHGYSRKAFMVLPKSYSWFFQKGIYVSSGKVLMILPEKYSRFIQKGIYGSSRKIFMPSETVSTYSSIMILIMCCASNICNMFYLHNYKLALKVNFVPYLLEISIIMYK